MKVLLHQRQRDQVLREPELESCGDEQEKMSDELMELSDRFASMSSGAQHRESLTAKEYASLKVAINGVPIARIKSLSFHRAGFEKDWNKDRGPT